MDYLTGDLNEREMLFDGFRQYALGYYDDIDKGLRRLYLVLAGREIENKSLRRGPEGEKNLSKGEPISNHQEHEV